MTRTQNHRTRVPRTGGRLPAITWPATGLIPAVVQDAGSHEVLMVAYMNRAALRETLRTGLIHFWSRSRRRLWRKGETSGHGQRVQEIWLDCDADTLLVTVEPQGPACHTGRWSCFFTPVRRRQGLERVGSSAGPRGVETATARIFERIYHVILARRTHPKRGSYVSSLFKMGKDQILKKVAEEAGELVIASKNNQRKALISEVADLWFHTLVALGYHEIAPGEIALELHRRFGRPARPSPGREVQRRDNRPATPKKTHR